MEAVENEKIPATLYYSEKDDKKNIECVRFQEKLYVNTNAEEGCELTTREPEESTEKFKSHIFTITAEELKKTENLLAFVAQRAQEELAKLPVSDSPAPATNGIAAGSTLVAPPAAKNTYNIHALIDKCRAEINAKLKPQNYSLPDGKYELVGKDGHKITIEANGNMAAGLAPINSKDEAAFAKSICDDLKAMVDMYKAMHDKTGIGLAAFPENKINLFVIKKDIKSEEDKIKIAKIEKLVAQEMHAYLSKPEHAVIKDKFTVLGKAVTKPAPAPAPKAPAAPEPSAPPLSAEDAKKAAENSDIKLPVIIPIQGKVEVATYKQNLQAKAEGTAPEKSAFIFPGNDGHAAQNDIHEVKSGGGLAAAAGELGKAGIGTLSLTTTFGGTSNATKASVDKLVKDEMAKLWQAIGAGYQLVLPVRSPNPKNFFSHENRQAIQNITGETNLEPSFWGNIQTDFANNTNHLPSYYCNELRDLQKFILDWNQPSANKKQLLADLEKQKPDFHKAFIQGFAQNPQNATKAEPDNLKMGPAAPASPRPGGGNRD
ncbi:MAG: hypothetical protein SFW07_01265 [Gammaproteobacteria bacterium]|nr:hypothetical protein [Gammaproteobacteria bacterium]